MTQPCNCFKYLLLRCCVVYSRSALASQSWSVAKIIHGVSISAPKCWLRHKLMISNFWVVCKKTHCHIWNAEVFASTSVGIATISRVDRPLWEESKYNYLLLFQYWWTTIDRYRYSKFWRFKKLSVCFAVIFCPQYAFEVSKTNWILVFLWSFQFLKHFNFSTFLKKSCWSETE